MQKYYDNSSLNERILAALKQSEYWTPKTKFTTNGTIAPLICPNCGEPNAWAYKEPMAVICNRKSQCGATVKTLELFPELRRNVERDCPPTKEDPNRPATVYLETRGIPPEHLQGLHYRYKKDVRGTGSGAVMFLVGKGENGREIWNGRLFSPPKGEGKTHNIGSTAGRCWWHPGKQYDPEKLLYVVEAIIDALSLWTVGQQAVAVLSAGQDPAKVELSGFSRLALAFDNDHAGHEAAKKWLEQYPDAETIFPDKGQDWNDFLCAHLPRENAMEAWAKARPRFANNAALALAQMPAAWIDTFYSFFHSLPDPPLFTFNGETYFAELKAGAEDKGPRATATRCLNATVKITALLVDKSNPAQPKIQYALEVRKGGRMAKPFAITATGNSLSSPKELATLFANAGAGWIGERKAAHAFREFATGPGSPTVEQLQAQGYQPDTKAYVLTHWAIDKNGKLLVPDSQGRFELGRGLYCQPPAHGASKSIAHATIDAATARRIVEAFAVAWNIAGLVALAWIVAAWFVNQIKDAPAPLGGYFPHLSLYGEADSGKSTLVRFLNRLQGQEGEGTPLSEISTKKGIARTVEQLSGMFTALKECTTASGYDKTMTLAAFDKGPLRTQAAYTNNSQTIAPPFQSAFLFHQNLEPFASKEERTRVISIPFQPENRISREDFEKLWANLDAPTLAGMMPFILQRRAHFEKHFRQGWKDAKNDLTGIAEERIHNTHALVLAFYRLLCTCLELKEHPDFATHLATMARAQCRAAAERQITLADMFFDHLESLTEEETFGWCRRYEETPEMAINLTGADEAFRKKGCNFNVLNNLPLTQSFQQHPAFIKRSHRKFPCPKEENESGEKDKAVWLFDQRFFAKEHKRQSESDRA